jgi:hypothetical protein
MQTLKDLLTYTIANWETLFSIWQGTLIALSTAFETIATYDKNRATFWKGASKLVGTFALIDGGRLVRYLKLIATAQAALRGVQKDAVVKLSATGVAVITSLVLLTSLGCSSTLEQSHSAGLNRLARGPAIVTLATRNTARCHQLSDREANWKAVETVSGAFAVGFSAAAWPVRSDEWEMVVVGTGVAGAAVTAYAESRRRSAQASWAEECSQ